MICPLCVTTTNFAEVPGPDTRAYFLCDSCQLIFTNTCFPAQSNEELTHNRKLENGTKLKSYTVFLNKGIQAALPFLNSNMQGLHFGCGPVPVLSPVLEKEGYQVDDYDPIFFPELPQNKTYDFIFASECFENFFFPAKDIQQLKKLLNDDGILVIMTERWKEVKDFRRWTYAKNPKHVSFYHSKTFLKICNKFGFEQQFMDTKNIVILQKIGIPKVENFSLEAEEAQLVLS